MGKIVNLFKLLNKAYGDYRKYMVVVLVLGFVSSILEGLGINSIIPLFSLVNRASASGDDSVTKIIENFFVFFHLPFTIRTLLILIFVLFMVKAAVVFIVAYVSARFNTRYERNTRSSLFRLTLGATWPYLSKQNLGHLEQVLTTDVNYSSNLLSYLSTVLLTVANLVVYGLIAINISPAIALLTAIAGVIIFFVFKPFFHKNKMLSGKLESVYKQLAHYVNESMLGVKTIKSLAVEPSVKRRGDISFDQASDLGVRIVSTRNFTNALLQPVGLLFVVLIFAFFYKMKSFNFASFAVIVYAINKIFAFLQIAQSQIHAISSYVPYVQSIERYREEVAAHQELDVGDQLFSFHHSLEFKEVNFSYAPARGALRDISFSIKKGEMLGIVGPSGAGKTTIVDLILRLLRPESGQILLDNQNITELPLTVWRSKLGYVSQDIFLMNDTIENNIRFYNDALTKEEMVRSAKMANILDFIESLPQKFSTLIGERGVKLSGGEKQRIILARTLARKPDILILDEATSALDNESELLIQKSIEGLKGTVTVVAIAHRLSTVLAADRLLVVENGTITEEGNPQEMLANKDSYFFKTNNVRS
ncbi:MAG: ABC transporter ATP-binding protein [Candidatus Magasanikbacteria bacterium]|nr:ABC transporter ATP-binding protein [Candidatus Magasanikbacteria bacterium]